jgi:hypothetical protein
MRAVTKVSGVAADPAEGYLRSRDVTAGSPSSMKGRAEAV